MKTWYLSRAAGRLTRVVVFVGVFIESLVGISACAQVINWGGAGTAGNEAIELSDPTTHWSNANNWRSEPAGTVPALGTEGTWNGPRSFHLRMWGRVYASPLETQSLTLIGSQDGFNWDGDLVLTGAEMHLLGNRLDLQDGAVIRQDGGHLGFVEPGSTLHLQSGSVYRMNGGTMTVPGTLVLGGGRTNFQLNGGHMTADEIVFASHDADICVWNGGSIRVRSVVLETERAHSCLGGRLEVQQITANGGSFTTFSSERVGLVAPTDIVANRETAILQIDGDITFWGGVEWQLHGTEPGLGYDQIDASGDLTISGILDFELLPLVDQREPIYLPRTGNTFDVAVADSFILTEIGLRLPTTPRGDLFDGHWGPIGDRRGLRLIAQYDYREALGDFNVDQHLDLADLIALTNRRGNESDDSIYDLDGNGRVDETDRRIWIHQLKTHLIW